LEQAVIIAGGKGTRLSSRLGDLPKPLVLQGFFVYSCARKPSY